jgi:hypothetical protein
MKNLNVLKSSVVSALVAAAASMTLGAEAVIRAKGKNPPLECMKTYTPLSLNIVTPVGLPWGFWDVKGLQIGGWNWSENCDGVQIGFINTTDCFRGLQIGGINVTRKMYGLQIGFLNIIEDNDVPFFPVLNWYF